MLRTDCRGHSLRNKIFFLAGHAVIKRPAVHRRKFFSKVTMSRRAWDRPFESIGVPWIVFRCSLPCKNAHQEVEQENQLGGAQNESRIRNEPVYRLLSLQE